MRRPPKPCKPSHPGDGKGQESSETIALQELKSMAWQIPRMPFFRSLASWLVQEYIIHHQTGDG
jgi:hypothetical protein